MTDSLTHSISDDEAKALVSWLVQIAESRDKRAFADLFRWFAPKIIRFGVRQFANHALAQELLQDTMTRVWRKAHMFSPDKGQATTWVYTIMRNTCFDTHRKMNTQKEDNLSDDIWPIAEANDITEYAFDDHLQSKQMRSYIDALPELQKQVVQGVYLQELSQEQLAKQLGIPLGTVKSRLRLALQKLRTQLETNHD